MEPAGCDAENHVTVRAVTASCVRSNVTVAPGTAFVGGPTVRSAVSTADTSVSKWFERSGV
jgi:hypothetical protein